jgi:hypothetical protein
MTRQESGASIEQKLGMKRDLVEHLAIAVSAEQRVYILHSQQCVDSHPDLRKCPFSIALDLGIDEDAWCLSEDRPVLLSICPDNDDLLPNDLPESADSDAESLDDCASCDAPLSSCSQTGACCDDCTHGANWPSPKLHDSAEADRG